MNMNSMSVPAVGSHVRVTTRYRNHYYLDAATKPWRDTVHEGVVVPNEKWDGPNTFCMTGNQKMPVRNIALGNVYRLEIVKGKLVKTDVRAFRVKSNGKTYVVTKSGKNLSCTCTGFHYRHKCKHVDAVAKKVK